MNTALVKIKTFIPEEYVSSLREAEEMKVDFTCRKKISKAAV